jgi:hypothetical protein
MNNDLGQTRNVGQTDNPQTSPTLKSGSKSSDFQPSTTAGTNQEAQTSLRVLKTGEAIPPGPGPAAPPYLGTGIGLISLAVIIYMLFQWIREASPAEPIKGKVVPPQAVATSTVKRQTGKKKPTRAQRKNTK